MDTKPWYQSTTIRGAIVAILGAAAGILSITGVVTVTSTEIDLVVTSLFTAIGGILAIVGRVKAKTTIAPPTGGGPN